MFVICLQQTRVQRKGIYSSSVFTVSYKPLEFYLRVKGLIWPINLLYLSFNASCRLRNCLMSSHIVWFLVAFWRVCSWAQTSQSGSGSRQVWQNLVASVLTLPNRQGSQYIWCSVRCLSLQFSKIFLYTISFRERERERERERKRERERTYNWLILLILGTLNWSTVSFFKWNIPLKET